MPTRLITIGGGVMARAIVLGAIERRLFNAGETLVIEPSEAARKAFTRADVPTAPSLAHAQSAFAQEPAPLLLIAVKPQSLPEVAQQWASANLQFKGIAISVLAGTPTSKVHAALGGTARILRAMPNTPARIAQGATAIALGTGALPGDEAHAIDLFASLGPVVEIVPESHMDAVTALSGSGPAYLFYLAESMQRAATDAGMDAKVADRLIRQTLLGAAALLKASPDEPAEVFRAAVTSKGGTTEAACRLLDERNVHTAIRDAVLRARDRGRELASGTPSTTKP